MATYFIGDVHGCSAELAALIAELAPGPEDTVYLAGDLFDRGPDPLGVLDQVVAGGYLSVMSNHEDFLMRAMQLYHRTGELDEKHEYIARCIRQVAPRAQEFYDYMAALPLYREGPGWLLVHAGIDPLRGLSDTSREVLLSARTWPPHDRAAPPWYHSYKGPPLVIFGHNAKRQPVMHRVQGRLVAVGLDTGCVYGGQLTALHLEEERLIQVDAARDYRRG